MQPGKVGWGPEQSGLIGQNRSVLASDWSIYDNREKCVYRGIGSVFLANHCSVTGIWFESQT